MMLSEKENMPFTATENRSFVAKKDAISCDLEGEAVIMQLGSGTYFGLNAIGAEIWKFIQEERSFSSIRQHLLNIYDVPVDQCELEVCSFLDQMTEQNLIESHANENVN